MSNQIDFIHEQIEKIYSVGCDHINVDVVHRYVDEQQEQLEQIAGHLLELAEYSEYQCSKCMGRAALVHDDLCDEHPIIQAAKCIAEPRKESCS